MNDDTITDPSCYSCGAATVRGRTPDGGWSCGENGRCDNAGQQRQLTADEVELVELGYQLSAGETSGTGTIEVERHGRDLTYQLTDAEGSSPEWELELIGPSIIGPGRDILLERDGRGLTSLRWELDRIGAVR
jgi:hypothetical protein